MNTETQIFKEFNWQVPKIVASIAQGEDAKSLYETLNQEIEANYKNNPNMRILSYDSETKSLVGSNIFIASRLSELLELSGIRTAIPSDDQYGDISRLVKDRFYTDFNALILRTAGDSYSPNDKIAKDLAEKIENREGKLKLPVVIVRPLVRYSEGSSSYDLVFDLDNKTQVIEDERLDGKKYPTGMKFNNVDDLGLPLFDKNGARTWHAREDGLSRLLLDGYLDLGSCVDDLQLSDVLDRVVVVSGKAASRNFSGLESYISGIQAEKAKEIKTIESRYEEALKILKGN